MRKIKIGETKRDWKALRVTVAILAIQWMILVHLMAYGYMKGLKIEVRPLEIQEIIVPIGE